MPISVVEPVSRAIEKTRAILFMPFDFNKWLGLGFCAFLAALGSGGGGGGVNFSGRTNLGPGGGVPGGGGTNGGPNPLNDVSDWISNNLALFILLLAAVLIFVLVIGALVAWLGSRGQFMFIDGIVHDRGLVRRPWHEFAAEGNSLFKFKVCLWLVSTILLAIVTGVCLLIAWSDISAKTFGTGGMIAAIVFGSFFFVFIIAAVIIQFLLTEFVVPAMYRRKVDVMEGWHAVGRTFSDHKGTLLLYFLFFIVLSMGVAVASGLACCFTCCLAAIPYVGSVILLPFSVFLRCYNLYFLEQFGPDWRFFSTPVEPDLPELDPAIAL